MVKTNLVMCRLFAGNVLSKQSKWQWLRSVFRWGASFAERRYSGSSKIIVARMGLLYNQRMNLFTQMPSVGYLSLCLGIISTTTYLLQDQTILLLLVSFFFWTNLKWQKLFYKCSIFIVSLLSFVAIVLVLNFLLISQALSAAGDLEYCNLICIFCLVEVWYSYFQTVLPIGSTFKSIRMYLFFKIAFFMNSFLKLFCFWKCKVDVIYVGSNYLFCRSLGCVLRELLLSQILTCPGLFFLQFIKLSKCEPAQQVTDTPLKGNIKKRRQIRLLYMRGGGPILFW